MSTAAIAVMVVVVLGGLVWWLRKDNKSEEEENHLVSILRPGYPMFVWFEDDNISGEYAEKFVAEACRAMYILIPQLTKVYGEELTLRSFFQEKLLVEEIRLVNNYFASEYPGPDGGKVTIAGGESRFKNMLAFVKICVRYKDGSRPMVKETALPYEIWQWVRYGLHRDKWVNEFSFIPGDEEAKDVLGEYLNKDD